MASHSRTRTAATRGGDSWGRDRAGRSTSVASSARLRRSDSPTRRGYTGSRSRSRSPKRRRQLDPEEDRRYRDRDRDRHHQPQHQHDSHSHSHSHRRHHSHHRDEHLRSKESSRGQGEPHRRKQEPSHNREMTPDSTSLPFGSRALSRKADERTFEPLFAYYLDLHKNLDISALPVDEVRGRWKSFVNKWNKGELAEGWYDPELFERVTREWRDGAGETLATWESTSGVDDEKRDTGMDEFGRVRQRSDVEEEEESGGHFKESVSRSPVGAQREKNYDQDLAPAGRNRAHRDSGTEDDEDDDYGPALPPTQRKDFPHKHGAEAPTLQDLTLRQESQIEDREAEFEALRALRKEDRKLQKERLDETLPRADAGTRERKIEKRKLVNEKMKGFRERSPGAAEVPEEDLLGGGEGDSLEEQKRRLKVHEIKVSERQLRREAMEREKAMEREERIREFKEREEKAVARLRELARRRFGAGGS